VYNANKTDSVSTAKCFHISFHTLHIERFAHFGTLHFIVLTVLMDKSTQNK